MPIENLNRYICPITGNMDYGLDLPPGWFTIEGEVFSPAAQVPLAQYVVAHPTVGFKELVASLQANPAETARAVHAKGKLPQE